MNGDRLDRLTGSGFIAVAAMLGILGFAQDLDAQSSPRLELESIQRIAVPDNRPKDWPFREQTWLPMNRDDYVRRLSRLLTPADQPIRPQWRHVRYSAAVAGDTLVMGRLQAQLQQRDDSVKFLGLGNPSLAIEELAWSNQPALWGTGLDGRQWLRLERNSDQLEGRWSARGRTLETGVAFHLELLPSAISELELQVPNGLVVTADVGDVELATPGSDETLSRWRISLGRHFRCRLTLAKLETAKSPVPTLLYKQESTVAVGQDELKVWQEFTAEILGGELSQLTISLPRSVEILSVISGDQTPLKFERIPGEGPTAQLTVHLTDGLQGRFRNLRVEGVLRRAQGESVAVPQFTLDSGLWLEGQVNVTVARPMELRSYRSPGYRQTAPAAKKPDGESISFQQLMPRAQLLLNVERPAVERLAHAINLLSPGPRLWTLTTEIAWESRSDTVFDASCRIPEGWQVIKVVQLGSGRESQELTGWDLQPHPDSGQLMTLEFPEGLKPGRVDSVRIIAQRDVSSRRRPTQVPVVVPVECEFSEVLLLLDATATKELALKSGDHFEPYDPTSATVWNTLPAWSMALNPSGGASLLHVIHPESPIPISVENSSTSIDAAVDVRIAIEGDRVVERFEVRLDEVSSGESSVEFYFPRSAAGIRWSAGDPAVELSAMRRSSRQSAASKHLSPDGEICIVALPERESDQVTVIGKRETIWNGDYPVPILLMPDARSFSGRITIAPDQDENYLLREISEDGRSSAPRTEDAGIALSSRAKEWSYRNAESGWLIQTRQRLSANSAQFAYALKSVITMEDAGYDYYQLTLSPSSVTNFDGCRFRLAPPAEFIAAAVDRQPVTVTQDGDELVIIGGEATTRRNDLVMSYRIPATLSFGRGRHRLEIPRFPGTCTRFDWQMCLPKSMEFRSPPFGLAMSPPSVQSNWWQRLWGPLSQSPAESSGRGESIASRRAAEVPALTASPWDLHFSANSTVYSVTGFDLPHNQEFILWDRTAIQLATWFLWLACLPVGWLLRRWPGAWRTWMLSAGLGLSGCLAVFGPEGWNTLSGGLFSGLMISLLLPEGSWRFSRNTPPAAADYSGSTELFRRTAVPLSLIIALGWGVQRSFAQQETSTAGKKADAANSGRKLFQVLMPVDQDQQPSETLPVVYVSPDLHEALIRVEREDASEPEQLIASSEYLVYLDQSRRQSIKIHYEIDYLTDEESPILKVPLAQAWRRGLESCSVDGQSQLATSTQDDQFLLIPCPRVPGKSDRSGRHQVLLEIRLPNALEPLQGKLRGELFPVLNSRLNWQSPESLAHVELPEARGLMTVSLDRRLVEAQLGAIRELTLSQTTDDSLSASEGRTELQMLQVLTLRPTLTQATFRVECRVLSGAVHRLEVELPSGGVVRDLRGNREHQTVVRSLPDAATKAVLEFSEPQLHDFVVEGEYILPRASFDQSIEFPRLLIRCGKSGVVKQSVAVACGPEFSAQLINLDDPTVLPILVDQLITQWGDTFPIQRPQFAFQVQDGGQPAFRLVPVQSDQQLLSWHEDVTFSRRGLDWELTAEMKTTAWPAYFYTVLLDRRLTIDSVSVRENGQELQTRWSKTPMIGSSQNRVTMFLNREAAGACQIRIHGNIRFRSSSPMLLPSVRFETPQSIPGSLSLFHEAGYRLQLEGRQTEFGAAPPSPEPSLDQLPVKFYQQLRIQEGESGLTARLEPVAGACTVQSLWLIDTANPAWRVRGWIELTPEEGTREVSVIVPEWLGQSQVISTTSDVPPVEVFDGGQRLLRVACSERETVPHVLLWDVELPATDESNVNLQLPSVPQARTQDDLAAILPEQGWRIADRSMIAVNGLSAAIREQLTQWSAVSVESVARLADGKLPLRRIDGQSPDGQSSLLFAEHALNAMPEGEWLGQSTFYPASTAGVIEIMIPADLDVIGLFADQTPTPLSELSAESRHWQVVDANRHRQLTVRWRAPLRSHTDRPIARASLPLPRSLQDRQPKTFIALAGVEQPWRIFPGNVQRRSRAEFAIDYLDLELQRYRQLPDSPAQDSVAGRRIWQHYRTAAESLTAQQALESLTDEDLRRWEGIVQAVSRIEETAHDEGRDLSESDFAFRSAVKADAVFGILTDETSNLSYWAIRQEYIQWTEAGLMLLACLWLLPKVLPWLLSPGWQERRHAAWLLFGIVWWLCWSPKIIALAMMAWSLSGWLRKRRTEWALAGQ